MKNPIIWLVEKIQNQSKNSNTNLPEEKTFSNHGSPCCDALVHIAYRGVSDDRLYLVHDKKWSEVKFFRPNGLRVYCHKCRQRIL